MKDDYLWDKTGEPEPEIEHLERVLGQLRSRNTADEAMRAFDNLQRTRPRPFRKALLIAASIAFALLALGVFAVIQRQTRQQAASEKSLAMVSPVPPETTDATDEAAPNVGNETERQKNAQTTSYEVSTTQPKRSTAYAPRRRAINSGSVITVNASERAEGMMAKEQLIKALQITSNKLNVVQKKVQGAPALGPSS